MIRSSALTLSVGYVLLGIVALVLFATPLWYAWRVSVNGGRTELLQEDAQRLSAIFQNRGADGLARFIDERIGLQIANERILLLADASLKPLAGNLPQWPSGVPEQPGTYTVSISVAGREIRAGLVRTALPGGYTLLVGRDVARLRPLEKSFWYGLAGAAGIFSLVGLIGGLLVRRVVLSRIDRINQTAARIMQGDLSHRLPLSRRDDEFNTLSRIINRMLDQTEQLVHGVRNVSNSIAHDLRTPLTELRSRLEELVILRPPNEEALAEIEAAVADVDRVIDIFNALLRLSKIDAGAGRSEVVEVDAADAAAKAVEFYQPSAELKGISLTFEERGEAPILGDPVLLAQAIGNLIDNALKFTPENGSIAVETRRRENGAVEITVADTGPGIPEAEKPRVIDRFYRGDASRGTPGAGLGLSLVGAVAKLHAGSLELFDNHPGLRARMILSGMA
ncbi:MAG TPA: HAMP domain-containing sensor histidine kinase [Burkholderiales bacterium]|nr:HAMP domain-containing sensor histidine kinase [Burkholderiales bacterium]